MLAFGVPMITTQLVRTDRIQLMPPGIDICDTKLYTHSLQDLPRVSVGIIPFSVDPKTQNIFLLLGKETCFTNFRSARGVWCDFGGKPGNDELTIITAGREFTEESLACVQIDSSSTLPSKMQEKVINTIQNEDFYVKIEVVSDTYWNERKQVMRVYYLKKIPWQPHIREIFQLIRNDLLFMKQGGHETDMPTSIVNHPAISSTLRGVQINAHYLEKYSINWWSIDRLHEVINNKGRFKNQRFRKSFLPVLRIVVEKLRTIYW